MRASDGSIAMPEITDEEKERLDMVHFLKISHSDAVVIVTDDTGYVGYSTKREILWAKMNGKKIHSSQFSSHIAHLTTWHENLFPVIHE